MRKLAIIAVKIEKRLTPVRMRINGQTNGVAGTADGKHNLEAVKLDMKMNPRKYMISRELADHIMCNILKSIVSLVYRLLLLSLG